MADEWRLREADGYKRAMLTTPPDVSWIVRGWRGVRAYFLRAAKAAEKGDVPGKLAALRQASELLAFLHRITPKGRSEELGRAISTLYERLHTTAALANAKSDPVALRGLSDDLASLEADFMSAYASARRRA